MIKEIKFAARQASIGIAELVVALVASAAIAGPATGQARPSLNVAQALSLLSALRNLDGHQVTVKNNGQDAVIMQPWDFGSGILRLKIANDITILAAVEKSADDARLAVIKEVIKNMAPVVDKDGKSIPATKVTDSQAGLDDFSRQYADVLDQPAKGADDLARIKASDLKLERNEIPVTALSALAPILDIDMPLK